MPKPQEGESQDEYIPRCIKVLMDEGKYPQKQCIAICYSMWKNKGKSNEEVVPDVEDKMMAHLYDQRFDVDMPLADYIQRCMELINIEEIAGNTTTSVGTAGAVNLTGNGKKKKKRSPLFGRLKSS